MTMANCPYGLGSPYPHSGIPQALLTLLNSVLEAFQRVLSAGVVNR